MEATATNKEFTARQQGHSAGRCGNDGPTILAAFQRFPANGRGIACQQPCSTLVAVVEELIRLKAQNKLLKQMLFGQSSEKDATVHGESDEDPHSPESEKSSAQKVEDPPPQDREPLGIQDEDHTVGPPDHEAGDAATPKFENKVAPIKPGRGAKPGHPGHGRHIPDNLVTREHDILVPDKRRICPVTGEVGKPLPRVFWEKSTQIEICLTAYLNVFYRERLKFEGCAHCPSAGHCPLDVTDGDLVLSQAADHEGAGVQTVPEFLKTIDNDDICPSITEPLQTPGEDAGITINRPNDTADTLAMHKAAPKVRFITAPEPPQAVNKSMLDHKSIALLIYLKYLLAIPLARISTLLAAACGLNLRPSTMTCTFKLHKDLLEKLYLRMAQEVKKTGHANADETRWMSFHHRDGKKSFMDWMWIIASPNVAFYVLDRSRSSKVLFKWLGDAFQGIITADRAHAYKKFAREVAGAIVSFCWAHFRRDFVRAAVGNALLRPWAKLWIGRILRIYRLNRERLKVLEDPEAYAKAQAKLEAAVKKFFDNIQSELSDPNLCDAQREVLESAVRHWPGLTVFVQDPLVPMDNNRAERLLRIVALGRKNFYGTYALWSGEFTAICLTILQTALMHNLEPMAYIKYYLDACAKAGGVPKDLEPHLPWNIPPDIRHQYSMSKEEQRQCA